MELFLFRLASGVFSVWLSEFLSFSNLVSVVFALAVSHNTLAFVYSESQRAYLTQNWRRHFFPLTLLAIATALTCWFDRPPVYFLFAIHHVCNETFFAQSRFRQSDPWLAGARAFMHAAAFFAFTRMELEYFGLVVPIWAWGAVLGTACAVFSQRLFRFRHGDSGRDALYELVAPAFAFASLATHSGTLDYVLVYHFLFWSVYPVKRLHEQGRLAAYLGWTVGLFAVGLLFTPIGPHWGKLTIDGLSYVTRLTSYFHFFSSGALSRAHPAWVRRWFFAPDKPAVAVLRKAA